MISYFDYQTFVDKLFVKRREGDEGLMHAASGLSGEAGECLDLVKKTWVYGKELDREKMIEEMGDTFHYLTMLCIKLGISPYDLMANNVAKLRKRYPDGYSDQAAIERKDQQPCSGT